MSCSHQHNENAARAARPSRREFLAAIAAAGPARRLWAQQPAPAARNLTRVVQTASNHVVRGRTVHDQIVREMLDMTMRRLAGTETAAAAWQKLLRPDDVIGLKFNASGADGLGTNQEFGTAVAEALLAAGFEPGQIVAIECPARVVAKHDLATPVLGWSDTQADFGSGRDQLADLLNQVTAIVNVPFIKTHNIAGMTCTLKNLSHALVKHPARFHANHCAPFIADIVALPQIRSKVRLHLVNGLRVVFDGGPEVRHEGVWDAGVLLAGTDPVAIDTLSLDMINSQREVLGLEVISRASAEMSYLRAAERAGLGSADPFTLGVEKLRI